MFQNCQGLDVGGLVVSLGKVIGGLALQSHLQHFGIRLHQMLDQQNTYLTSQ